MTIFGSKMGFFAIDGQVKTSPPSLRVVDAKKNCLTSQKMDIDQFLQPAFAEISHFLVKN